MATAMKTPAGLAAAAAWLLSAASHADGVPSFLSGLTRHVKDQGAPLVRASLVIEALHPTIAGTRYMWRADTGESVEEPRFHGFMSGQGGAAAAPPVEPPGSISQPVRFSDGSTHQVTWTADRLGGFTPAETEALATLAALMAAPLEVLVAREMATTLLNTYLGPRSGRQVLSGRVRRGDGETIHAVIWLSDLRGFAALSEKLSRDDLIALLNAHFERLAGPIRAFGGEVLKFMGDGLLAIFPIADANEGAGPATAAVRAARSALTSMRQFNEGRRRARQTQLRFGLALHVGDVHYGNIGSPDRLDFTAIGPAVNLASRMERLTKRLRCPVLLSGDFVHRWDAGAVLLGSRKLRGIAEPVDLYTLPEFAPNKPRSGG